MKKNNIKFCLLIILCTFFIMVNNAKAGDFDDGSVFNIKSNGTGGTLTHSGGLSYETQKYTASSESGNSYDAFCIDPAGQAWTGNATVHPVSNASFAAALSSIVSSNADYTAKRTAIVAFVYGVAKPAGIDSDIYDVSSFTNWQKGSGALAYASAFTNTGIEWACQNESLTSQLVNISGNCVTSLQSSYTNVNSYNSTYKLESGHESAYSLFVNALQAAVDAKNGSANTDTSSSLEATLNDPEINDDNVVITATFDIKDMSKNGYLRNINFTINGDGYGNPEATYSVNNGEEKTLTLGSEDNLISELVENLEDGKTASGTVTIKFTLSKPQTDSDEECTPASFTITYDYSGKSNAQVAIASGKSNGSIPQQNYLIYFAMGNEEETDNQGKLEGEIPCDNNEEIVCGTLITTPICSDNEEESTSDIVAPDDIKKCILGYDNANGNAEKKDDAGNSYKLSDSYGGLSDNDYCQVFCKEDYKDVLNVGDYSHGIILQPKIDDVVCGGYFQLKAHIEGAKDCYTGGNTSSSAENGEKSIDKEKYIEEIKEIENNMVDAITKYNEAVITLEKLNSADIKETTITKGSCSVTNYTIKVESDEYTKFTFEWNEDDESGKYEESSENTQSLNVADNQTCVYDKDSDSYVAQGEATAKQQYDELKQNMENQKATALSDFNTAKEEYKEKILMYNECISGWFITYDFAQTVRYYYDETQGDSGDYTTTIPYFSLIQENVDNTIMVPNEEEPYQYLVDVEICKETATNEYECEGDSVSYRDFDEATVGERYNDDDYGYAGVFANAYEEKNYVLCDITGSGEGTCDDDKRQISQASFVRKSIKKAQDYISPSVFWQIAANGKITTSSSGNNVELEQLENMLPVSTKSILGGTFRLMLEDFGEFYDPSDFDGADKYGRLIDYMGDNESKSVANALGYDGTSGFDGNYECYYVNNCKPDDCPDCDYVDTGIPNCPNCNFTSTSCINCIFNLDELQINVKPINPSDVINPDRTYGYNWTVNTELGRLALISDKAEMTINEIKENNDLVYSSTKVTDENGLAFSIRLDASAINYLKEYNAAQESNGGYTNDSLTCEDATFGELNVENLFCYSEVITKLVDDNSSNSIPEGFKEKRDNVDEYWTTFPNWQEIVGDEKTDAGQSYVIGGPAWK